MDQAELSIWDGPATMEHFADIRSVFHAAYPRRSVADHRDLLTRQAASYGFMACVASVGGRLVGCAYGLPLQLGTLWWRDLSAHLGDDFVWEDGLRTFALLELCVSPLAPVALRAELLRVLLARRRESRVTTHSSTAAAVLPWRSCGDDVWVLALPV
ncbi:hypothetical protein [Kineosporia babensis]|uniref:Uncharacterized protein n=1 Tax=Kineosporia babensis TaxID=499548 RepID=A0A9X1SXS7_9ACTN|nr:hypothetical protein [Kineosporia babensis]MCD5310423.1 hypothetical protein [Kineosporia babensis]